MTKQELRQKIKERRAGIDPSRVMIDERARTTLENAENTFAMIRAQLEKTVIE